MRYTLYIQIHTIQINCAIDLVLLVGNCPNDHMGEPHLKISILKHTATNKYLRTKNILSFLVRFFALLSYKTKTISDRIKGHYLSLRLTRTISFPRNSRAEARQTPPEYLSVQKRLLSLKKINWYKPVTLSVNIVSSELV